MLLVSILATAFVLALLLTGLLRNYALRVRMLDIPNQRSSHNAPVPRGGGVAVVVASVAGTLALAWVWDAAREVLLPLLIPCLLVAGVGWLDDHRPLPARIRLAVHLVAAGLALILLPSLPPMPVFSRVFPLSSWGLPLLLLGLAWAVNLNNFMDGIDGIASVEAITVACGAAAILRWNGDPTVLPELLLLLAAAVAGFLAWNWPPARIFMGDACSGFLGMAIGVFALATSAGGSINLWSWLILYGVFAVDATCTLCRRFLRGEKLHLAHRSHAYQILSRRWQSHRRVTLLVLAVNICWLFPLAVVSSRHPEWAAICALVALAPLVFGVLGAGAGTDQ